MERDTSRRDAAGPLPGEGLPPGPGDVVLVDDERTVAELARRVLRHGPWRLCVFEEPEAALAHLLGHAPDVLLVDSRMPGMDGAELIVRLAERGRLGAGRVFLSSAAPIAPSAWLARLPARVRVLPKGELFDRRTLLARIAGEPVAPAPDGARARRVR